MKTEDELDEMSDEQLLRYFNRRFKSPTVNDTEHTVYLARSRPCKHDCREATFHDKEFLDIYQKMGWRIIKYTVAELISPGKLIKDI